MSGERRRWGLGRKLLLQLALAPLLLGVVELAYRGWSATKGRPHDAAAVERELLGIAEQVELPLIAFNAGRGIDGQPLDLTARRIPSPYYGWDYENRFPMLARRAVEFDRPSARERYEILVLGGSVAAGFWAFGSERLTGLIAADPRFEGRRVATLSSAHGGFKQPQQLGTLTYLLGLGWRPDAVINVDGFNEVAIGNENAASGAHPLHPSVEHWSHLLILGRAGEEQLDALEVLRQAQARPRARAETCLRLGLHHSAVLARYAVQWVRSARRDYNAASGAYGEALARKGVAEHLLGPPPPVLAADVAAAIPPEEAAAELLAARLEVVVDGWASASRSMQAICDALGIHYLHVLQPTLHDPGSKPLTDEELRNGLAGPDWVAGARAGYPLLRARGALLREEGVRFLDASLAFADRHETLYVDACHFEERGNEILAELVARRFLAELP